MVMPRPLGLLGRIQAPFPHLQMDRPGRCRRTPDYLPVPLGPLLPPCGIWELRPSAASEDCEQPLPTQGGLQNWSDSESRTASGEVRVELMHTREASLGASLPKVAWWLQASPLTPHWCWGPSQA